MQMWYISNSPIFYGLLSLTFNILVFALLKPNAAKAANKKLNTDTSTTSASSVTEAQYK
jgi:hypothetical protein